MLVHAREGLDWTDRGRVAGVSNEEVADTPLRVRRRSSYQNKCFGTCMTLGRAKWGPVDAFLMRTAEARWRVACKLLAALAREPGLRCLYSVVGLAKGTRPARGASWTAVRRLPRGRNGLLVLQPC